jgi:hypothetical protein
MYTKLLRRVAGCVCFGARSGIGFCREAESPRLLGVDICNDSGFPLSVAYPEEILSRHVVDVLQTGYKATNLLPMSVPAYACPVIGRMVLHN